MKKYFLLILTIAFSINLKAQKLEATESQALVNLTVTNFEAKPLKHETIIFVAQKTKKEYAVKTGDDGKGGILVPKGDTYLVKYKDLTQKVDYSQFKVPNQPGKFSFDVLIKYEPSKLITLDNVYFDTDKATIKPASYKQLNEIADLLKEKKSMEIEIAGHTDNVGSDEHNMDLSQRRADAIRNYLIKQGANPAHITAVGYGSSQPIASNAAPEGRAKNRRIEVRITKEYK